MTLGSAFVVWVVSDPLGRPVSLLEERKQHIITGHPEMGAYMSGLETVITMPHMILQDQFDVSTDIFCKLNVGMGSYSGKWLKVPVRYDITDSGQVITAHFTGQVPDGTIKWMPPKLRK